MKKTVILLILALTSASVYASSDWKGKLTDENGAPLPYANVAILSKADSTVITGVTTDENGLFNIVSDRKDVLLMATMIGYTTQIIAPHDNMTVRMVPDKMELKEAIASAVMPKTKLTGEGLQTSVRGTVLENAGTANDVLAKTPGMIRGKDGLEVIGKGSPLVYINGRKVTDISELNRLPSNEIQNIEVITNPGAQYDASVRSVVRIRTIKRQGDGFGFNATLKDEQSLRRMNNDPNGNLDMNYRIGSVDVFAGANVFKASTRQDSDIFSETFGKPSYSNDGWVFNDCSQQSVKATGGVNWQIATSHSVGFKVIYGVNYAMKQYQELYDKMQIDGKPYDETYTKGNHYNGDTAPQMVNTNAYYTGQAGKLGIDLNIDFYRMYDSNYAEIIESSSLVGGDAQIKTSSASDNNLYAAKLVLSYPFWQGQFQLGTEDTFSRRGDDYSITGSTIPPSSSNVSEDNIAAFASYGFAIQKVGQFSAGLRYEHVNYSYDDHTGTDSFSRKYDNVFPTVSYAGALGTVQLMASYSEKTLRPGFGQLSSAVRYNSKYIIQSGNAALQPQNIHDANLMANWKWMTLVSEYSRTDNAITSWSSFDDKKYGPGVMMVKPCNLDSPLRSLGVFLNAAPTIGIWTMNYTAGVQQQWLKVAAPDPREASGIRITSFSKHPMLFAQLFNTLSLKKDWQLELGGEYHSKSNLQNAMITNNYFNLTAAIQKALLKDKSLVVRLEGNDMAGLANYNIATDYGSTSIVQTNILDTKRITLSIRYRFNATQSKYKGTGAGKDVVSRMK